MRAQLPNRVVLVVLLSLTVGCTEEAAAPPSTTTTTSTLPEVAARIVVHQRPGLDDVLLLGAPFGVDDRGVLVTVDLGTGDVDREVHGGDLWPPGFKEPTTEPDHPDADAAARSPDGLHVASFDRSADTRATGVTIVTGDRRRFHRLQSIGEVVGGRLAWSADSDAVYLIAGSVDGSADRVVGIPVTGSAQTVVRLDERGFTWLAVE